jgi:hypothetical protein
MGSFLDVVTNMVGILIILVMILGLRIKSAPVSLAPDAELVEAAAALKSEETNEHAITAEVLRTAEEIRGVEQTFQSRARERAVMATLVSAAEQKIAERRKQLSEEARGQFDFAQALRAAQDQLDRLREQKAAAAIDTSAPIQVESYPTPISKTVTGDELHFQLRHHRIAVVPMDDLSQKLKADLPNQFYKLRDVDDEVTETIGPVGGFRMRYTLRRFERYVRLMRWELVPVSEQLGETLAEAAAPDSQFRQTLAGLRSSRYSVTLWTYPDSFAEFRQLKKEFYQAGFATAGRPLPEGHLIAFSPDGSRSAAE